MPDDLERAQNRAKKYSDTQEWVDDCMSRLEARQCMICAADSGNDLILPPGWSYRVFAETGEIAGFFCDQCAARHAMEENRNYAEDQN